MPEERDRTLGRGVAPAWQQPDDNLGTLGLIGPDEIRLAAREVTAGRIFPLNWQLESPDPPLFGRRRMTHHVRHFEDGTSDDFLDGFHPQASTQWDALSHVRHPRSGYYGGRTDDDVARGDLGIHHIARHGIAGRFVLVDLARHRRFIGEPLDMQSTWAATPAEIEAALQSQHVEVRPGDVLLLRFGWTGWYDTLDTAGRERFGSAQFAAPGIAPSREMAAWIESRRIAALAADNPALEAMPIDFTTEAGFLHRTLIAGLGLLIGELFALDVLARFCADTDRWHGMFVSAPAILYGGVGSPANALAVM